MDKKELKISCLLFHSWNKWEDKTKENFGVYSGEKFSKKGFAIIQERRCTRCNKVQLRTAKTSL